MYYTLKHFYKRIRGIPLTKYQFKKIRTFDPPSRKETENKKPDLSKEILKIVNEKSIFKTTEDLCSR